MTYTYKRAATVKMERKEIQDINAALRHAGLDGNGRFKTPGHAHTTAGRVLERYGYEFSDMLHGWDVRPDNAMLSLRVAKSTPGDPFSPVDVQNTAMAFSYTRLREDAYDVVAYLGF